MGEREGYERHRCDCKEAEEEYYGMLYIPKSDTDATLSHSIQAGMA